MYIDGVFCGGGIKGFALIGAIMELEQEGYAFKRVAGTSAGSIIAGFLAAGYSGAEIKLLMEDVELNRLLETRKRIQFPFARWLKLYWTMGLYKGDALECWIKETLEKKGIRTFGDLPDKQLRIIASDLSNSRMLILPDDLAAYNINPKQFPVAKAIRMSCSIPFFFEPIKLKTVGEKYIIVDGGVLSNFPIWLFDQDNVKSIRPVLGLNLVHEKTDKNQPEINNAIGLFSSLFETMRNAHDSRYISRKFVKNIIFIPVKDASFIEFSLTEEQRTGLIESGRRAAAMFVKHWTHRIKKKKID